MKIKYNRVEQVNEHKVQSTKWHKVSTTVTKVIPLSFKHSQ